MAVIKLRWIGRLVPLSALLLMACGSGSSSDGNDGANSQLVNEQNNINTSVSVDVDAHEGEDDGGELEVSLMEETPPDPADNSGADKADQDVPLESVQNDLQNVPQDTSQDMVVVPINPAPFFGSIYVDPDIIRTDDPTTYVSNTYVGRGRRVVYDRREGWVTIWAYLFRATYSDGRHLEFQVNPEFGSIAAAQIEVDKYGPPIGRVPTGLRTNVSSVTIHKGKAPYGGGNKNLLIHTDQTYVYESRDILEETFVHEAAHATLDGPHAHAQGWQQAQMLDNGFITEYAQEHPEREDIAESFLFYLAVRYRPERISQNLYDTIMSTMAHRIAYFDQQEIDVYPVD